MDVIIIDHMVLATQVWLNMKYGDDPRYNVIEENGRTGWSTIYALTRALQIELGIQNTADSFGPTTQSLYQILEREDGMCRNQFAILQGTLWCKGYNTGHYATYVDGKWVIDDTFDESVENAVKQLETDAGRNTPTGKVDVSLMKALLSMDAFVRVVGGDSNIRTIQQYLNRNYEPYIGLKPCDGVYGRGTNTAMIYAIQAEEDLPVSQANGNFGPTTRNCCPTIPYNGVEKSYIGLTYNTARISKFITLLQMSLYINGFGNTSFNGIYDTSTQNAVTNFQQHYALNVTGIVSLGTWLSLLISCGDTSRPAIACDCATILDEEKAQTLYNNGYRYVGRYLSGTIVGGASKALSREEMQIAFNAGLRIFPIQQGSAHYVEYFTEEQAEKDAQNALFHANNLGIPINTIIYFAVDCDPQNWQITDYIIPYFKKVSELLKSYRIGIYGTRNACTRVSNLGYAVSSFVSDMSTGFSGNLGFKIPDNWAFDQFTTIWVGSGAGRIEIDKNGFSGRDTGFGEIDPTPMDRMYNNLLNIYNLAMNYTNNNRNRSNELVVQYLRKSKYNNIFWNMVAGNIDNQFCSLVDSTYQNFNFTFFDPAREEQVKHDIFHLAAVLNSLLYKFGGGNQPALDELTNVYAGWGGDAISFSKYIRIAHQNGEVDYEQWAKDNICQNNYNTNFGLDDYIGDIDAINIYNLINDYSMSLPDAFLWYYDTPLEDKTYAERRTSRFMNSNGTYYLEEMCDLLMEDELNMINMILPDQLSLDYIEPALNAFKSFVYKEYFYGR